MKKKMGFTIIEMMVAMAVLSMLVVAMSRIFQQSLVATDTGCNLAKGTLVGRTIMQYVAEDLGNCTEWIGASESQFEFDRNLASTDSAQNSWLNVTYVLENGVLRRNTDSLFEPSDGATVELVDFDIKPDDENNPTYFDVFLSVKVKKYADAAAEGIDTKNFTSRVYLQNNNRYKYGKYSEL